MFERPTGPLPAMSGVTVRDRSGLSGALEGLWTSAHGTPFGRALKAVGEVWGGRDRKSQ